MQNIINFRKNITYKSRNKKYGNNEIMYFHIILSTASLLGYYSESMIFKIIMIPYVLFLVFSKKAIYYPSILLHTLPGTVITHIILLSVLIITIINYRKFINIKLDKLFIITLIPIPILLWVGIYRAVIDNSEIVKSLMFMMPYLGLFCFYYGIFISKTFTKNIWSGLLTVFLIMIVFQELDLFGTIRTLNFIFPFTLGIAVYSVLKNKRIMTKNQILIIFIIQIYHFINFIVGSSLTNLTTLIFSIILLLLYIYNYRIILNILFKPISFAFIIFIFILLVSNYGDKTLPVSVNDAAATYELRNYDQMKDRITFKLFADRLPLWKGSLELIYNEFKLFPSTIQSKISVKYESQMIEREVEYGAHNLYLDLIIPYGLIIGTMAIVVYILLIIIDAKNINRINTPAIYIICFLTIFSISFIGSISGSYMLSSNFSLLLMGLAGIVHSKLLIER